MEIKKQIIQRILDYETGDDYTPLQIVMDVIPPIYIASPWLHLDSILSYLCLRDALGDLFYCMPTEETIDVSLLNLPLKRTSDVYHSSVGIYANNVKLYRDTIYKRFTDKETHKLTHRQQKGRIKTNQGHFKDFMINLPIIITDTITFYCNGDKKELERLLSHLTSIGKKTSIGGGRIRNITITETNEDYSFFKDNCIMRPIPATMDVPVFEGMIFQQQPYKPPYWDKNNVCMCIVPENQIKLK